MHVKKDPLFSPDVAEKITSLADEISASGVLKDRESLAGRLLDMALAQDPALNREKTRGVIQSFVTNPDFLLFVAGAATLSGNASYAMQYASKAEESGSASDRAVNLIHTVVFSSFALEKVAGIGQAGLSGGAKMSRRKALQEFASYMGNNYPMMAGGWHVGNQVSSGLAFAVQAGMHGEHKDAVTAGTRAMAASAALGMTLYKYHALIEKEREQGVTLVDPRIRRIMEPIDRMLGRTVDAAGGAFPYIAAAMLTGPHASIFHAGLTDKQNPHVSVPPIMMMVGYSALVGYLSCKPSEAKPDVIGEAVTHARQETGRLQESFKRLGEALLARQDGHVKTGELSGLLVQEMGLGKSAAPEVAKAAMKRLEPECDGRKVMAVLAQAVADYHVAGIERNMPPENSMGEAGSLLRQQLGALLESSLAGLSEQLSAQPLQVDVPVMSRRRAMFGWGS